MFFVTPNYCVACVPKVGSCTLARAIIKTFYLEIDLPYSEDFCQEKCPHIEIPDRPVVALVRDPVDRFLSAMESGLLIDVEATLMQLESPTGVVNYRQNIMIPNPHFLPQSNFIPPNAMLFPFPNELNVMAQLIGLLLPLPWRNRGRFEKQSLTEQQILRVRNYYVKDCELYAMVRGV